MKLIALSMLAFFFATGFTACERKCEPVVVVKEVSVPVPVECEVTWPEKPKAQPIPAGFYDRGVWIMKEDEAQRKYADALAVALAKCSKNK
jgi:hypothetical protein